MSLQVLHYIYLTLAAVVLTGSIVEFRRSGYRQWIVGGIIGSLLMFFASGLVTDIHSGLFAGLVLGFFTALAVAIVSVRQFMSTRAWVMAGSMMTGSLLTILLTAFWVVQRFSR